MTDFQITQDFAEPFFTGSARGLGDSGFFPVAINGLEFMVDLASGLYRRFNVDVLRTRQNRQANESLLVEPEVWRSTVESWHQGAGQTRYDRETSLAYRFFSSKNVDPWDQWRLSLLDGTEQVRSSTGEQFMEVAYSATQGQCLFFSDDNGDFWYTDLGGAPTNLNLAAPVRATTSDGVTVYAALNNLDIVAIKDGVVSTYMTLSQVPQMISYMKGFLIAGIGPALYDISGGVADPTTLIFESSFAEHRWVATTDGLSAGYILGGQGDKWQVYWMTVREDASTLNPPVVAAPLPDGEVGHSLGSYLGFVLIGTERGVRFASPGGDNTLTYGRLVVTGQPVKGFEGQDRFVWFGVGGSVRDQKDALRQPEAGLARMDLSTFTAPLTPAFASDLIADGEPVETATLVATVDGGLVFCVPGQGLYRQTLGVPAESGYLVQGLFNQGVRDVKIGLYAHISCEPLQGSIYVDLGEDSVDYVEAIGLDAPGVVTSGNVDIDEEWEGLAVRYRLLASDADASPVMTRFEVRCVPRLGRAHEWQVPLVIASVYDYRETTQGVDIENALDSLIALVEQGRVFTFREGDRSYQCFSPGYEWRPTSQVAGSDKFQGVFVLRIREIR